MDPEPARRANDWPYRTTSSPASVPEPSRTLGGADPICIDFRAQPMLVQPPGHEPESST